MNMAVKMTPRTLAGVPFPFVIQATVNPAQSEESAPNESRAAIMVIVKAAESSASA